MDDTITFKIDLATKRAAESLADEVGLSFEDLVNACLNQAVVSRHLGTYPIGRMSPKTEEVLERAEQELADEEFSEAFDNAKDAIDYLKEQSS